MVAKLRGRRVGRRGAGRAGAGRGSVRGSPVPREAGKAVPEAASPKGSAPPAWRGANPPSVDEVVSDEMGGLGLGGGGGGGEGRRRRLGRRRRRRWRWRRLLLDGGRAGGRRGRRGPSPVEERRVEGGRVAAGLGVVGTGDSIGSGLARVATRAAAWRAGVEERPRAWTPSRRRRRRAAWRTGGRGSPPPRRPRSPPPLAAAPPPAPPSSTTLARRDGQPCRVYRTRKAYARSVAASMQAGRTLRSPPHGAGGDHGGASTPPHSTEASRKRRGCGLVAKQPKRQSASRAPNRLSPPANEPPSKRAGRPRRWRQS